MHGLNRALHGIFAIYKYNTKYHEEYHEKFPLTYIIQWMIENINQNKQVSNGNNTRFWQEK